MSDEFVTEDSCKARVAILEDKIIDNGNKLDKLLSLWEGNGKLGLKAKILLLWEWMVRTKKDKHNLGMYAYRITIGVILTFIAIKVGLR